MRPTPNGYDRCTIAEIPRQATYADAILDRLIHNAHRPELSGESMSRVNAGPIVLRSAEVKVPSFAGQGPGWAWPFLGGRPRRRDTGADIGGVMVAFERTCSGMSSACWRSR